MRPGLADIEERLRGLLRWRDSLAAELSRVDAAIGAEARNHADATGCKVKPTLPQLRRQLNERESP